MALQLGSCCGHSISYPTTVLALAQIWNQATGWSKPRRPSFAPLAHHFLPLTKVPLMARDLPGVGFLRSRYSVANGLPARGEERFRSAHEDGTRKRSCFASAFEVCMCASHAGFVRMFICCLTVQMVLVFHRSVSVSMCPSVRT